MHAPTESLRLGTMTLDLSRGLLLDAAGVPVALRPQSWKVLCTLALEPGRVHSKEDLLDAVWPGIVVTDDSLVQAIGGIRQALGDAARDVLRTVPRRGYMLVPGEHTSVTSQDGAPPSAEVQSLGERLRRQAAQRFVGRDAELQALRPAVGRLPPARPLFFVHGPGGIGKSSLLEQLRLLAAPEVEVVWVNGAELLPTPQGVIEGVGAALGLKDWEPTLEALVSRWSLRGRGVLLLDTFEALEPVQGWMRDTWLPSLPARISVVLAGRRGPDSRWSAHPLWADAMHAIGLEVLGPEACARLAQAHGAPAALCEGLAERAHGLPLAAVLLAAEARDTGALPDNLGDALVQALTRRCIEHAPSAAHREALLACALARRATRDLLAHLFGDTSAEGLFEWLASQGYVGASRDGLRLHDLMREAVLEDVAWCDRDRFRSLRRAVARYLATRVRPGRDAWDNAVDFFFSFRRSSSMRRFFDFDNFTRVQAGVAQPEEREAARALAARLLPPSERGHFDRWVAHPAAELVVAREEDGRICGAALVLMAERLGEEDFAADAILGAIRQSLGQRTRVRTPGAVDLIERFIFAEGGLSTPNPALTALLTHHMVYITDRRTGLWVLFGERGKCLEELMVHYSGWDTLPDLFIRLDGVEHFAPVRDWQLETWPDWLDRMVRQAEVQYP